MKKIDFTILDPMGNLTALVETSFARGGLARLKNKNRHCEKCQRQSNLDCHVALRQLADRSSQ